MKKKFLLLLSIGIFFWSCSDDSPLAIGQFDLEIDEISSSIVENNYGVNISGETNYSLAYEEGYIRSDRIKLELETLENNFLNFEIYRKDEAVANQGEDWENYESEGEYFIANVSDSNITTYWNVELSQNFYYTYQIVTRHTTGIHHIDELIIKTPLWDAPSDIGFNPLSPSVAQITWIDNSESEERFELTIDGNGSRESYEADENQTSYIVENLDAGENYIISIYAANAFEGTSEEFSNINKITPIYNITIFDIHI